MAKNIEMNIKTQEQNYEILYPKTIPNQVENLLNDETKELMGLEKTDTPDDAFKSLYFLNVLGDKSAFKLTVKTQNNKIPLPNIQVQSTSFIDSKGNPVPGPLLTNEKGEINTFFKNGSVTLKIEGYADLENWNQTYEIINGEQYEYEAFLTTINFQHWLKSQQVMFSSNVQKIDINCVGGGGSGGRGYGRDWSFRSGPGGGGGHSVIQEDVEFIVNQNYNVVIGAGGKIGDLKSYNGGDSSFNNIIAKGGGGVYHQDTEGGIGNGNGGNTVSPNDGSAVNGKPGTNGTEYGYSSFTDTIIYGGGGGSGSAGEGGVKGGVGGTFGGTGAGGPITEGHTGVPCIPPEKGTGGGGAGTARWSYSGDADSESGSDGASGSVNIRIHLKNT